MPVWYPADPLLRHLFDGDVLATFSRRDPVRRKVAVWTSSNRVFACRSPGLLAALATALAEGKQVRSEEHTSELQSHLNLVCRLLLEKKKKEMPAKRRDQRVQRTLLTIDTTLPHLS